MCQAEGTLELGLCPGHRRGSVRVGGHGERMHAWWVGIGRRTWPSLLLSSGSGGLGLQNSVALSARPLLPSFRPLLCMDVTFPKWTYVRSFCPLPWPPCRDQNRVPGGRYGPLAEQLVFLSRREVALYSNSRHRAEEREREGGRPRLRADGGGGLRWWWWLASQLRSKWWWWCSISRIYYSPGLVLSPACLRAGGRTEGEAADTIRGGRERDEMYVTEIADALIPSSACAEMGRREGGREGCSHGGLGPTMRSVYMRRVRRWEAIERIGEESVSGRRERGRGEKERAAAAAASWG